MRFVTPAALIAGLTLTAAPALADRGGNGNGQGHGAADPASGSCLVSDGVVSAVGLPTDEVINFLITDNGGTWGWVLGMSDGTWSVEVPAPNGPSTYHFAGRTWGPNGTKYNTFASCS